MTLGLFDSEYLDTTPKTRYMKEIPAKLDLITIKNFCYVKDTNKRMDRQAMDWEKKFATGTSKENCYPKYTKNS